MEPNPDADLSGLIADLAAARFTVDRLTALWGADAAAALERGNRVPAVRAARASDAPVATLGLLFVLGESVDIVALDRALPTAGAAGAAAAGLVALVDGRAHPAVDLRPYAFLDARGAGEWWIASDLGELSAGGPLRTDHVLGVGGASITLAGLLLPGPVERALDLGTGCGIQALHLAREARHVVATDISARALLFARLNAALNGVTTIEFHQGDLFAPVAGERFDRIASNPPFVITPRTAGVPAYEYRDGGRTGDALVAEVVAGAAAHLAPGGVAQLLGNWEYRADEDGLRRARGWARDAGLESWIVERDTADPARYAETWIRDGGTRPGTPGYDALIGAWLDDFAARGVTSVGFGYLLLRRPADGGPGPDARPRLARSERIDAPLGTAAGGLGAHLGDVLAALDRAAALDDEQFLRLHARVAPDVTEERSHWPGEPDPTVIVLRQGGGFRREIRTGTALAAVVGACDGDLALGPIIGAVADLLEVDAAALTAALVPELRELIAGGLILIDA